MRSNKKKKMSRRITRCQISNSKNLKSILNLGSLPPVNKVQSSSTDLKEQTFYPIDLLYCPLSSLVQLGTIVDKEILFPSEYPYTSSTTKILRENFKELSQEIRNKFNFDKKSLVIDIGSNDGNLLTNFKKHFNVLGVTPEKIGKIAIKKGIPTLIKYFDNKTVKLILKKYGKANIITATNVFAHIDNVNNVIANINKCLNKNGIFVSESHYLMPLIKKLQYDTIYHEHLRYYSLLSLKYLFKKHNLEIFYAKEIPTHGGSIRVYVARKNLYKKHKNVENIIKLEKKYINKQSLKNFSHRVIESKINILKILNKLKKNNKNIAGISAPSRASTLINYVGIDRNLIDCIFEIKNSHKIGFYMPGTNIPIVEEKSKLLNKYDFLVLFSWHISKDLIKSLKKRGYKGKFIVPLPKPKII